MSPPPSSNHQELETTAASTDEQKRSQGISLLGDKSDSRTEDLRPKFASLRGSFDGISQQINELEQTCETYLESFLCEKEKAERLERELNMLREKHILSVNSTGTGLSPITDDDFGNRFQKLHDAVRKFQSDLYYLVYIYAEFRN